MRPFLFPSGTQAGRLIFILGHPISHSLSPGMQNAALRYQNIPWLYLPLDIQPGRLRSFLRIMKGLPVQGANVTVPYKEKVLEGLDEIDATARSLGSVNTIYRRGRKLVGTSTDGEGFLRSLGPKAKNLRGSMGLLLGAGGAGRAVAFALASRGIGTLLIANRSSRRAAELVQSLRKGYPDLSVQSVSFREAEGALTRCDWAVQTTSLGLKEGDRSPISLAGMRRSAWAVELIYHRETAFLREARKRGVRVLDGSGMLLHQGALSFEYWTGRKAPVEVMRRCLLEQLPRKGRPV